MFSVGNQSSQTGSVTMSYTSKRALPEEKPKKVGRPATAARKQFQDDESSASQKDACLYDLIRNGKSSLTVM